MSKLPNLDQKSKGFLSRIRCWFFGSGGLWGMGCSSSYAAYMWSIGGIILAVSFWVIVSMTVLQQMKLQGDVEAVYKFLVTLMCPVVAAFALGKLFWHPWGEQIGFYGGAKLVLFIFLVVVLCCAVLGLLVYVFEPQSFR